MAFDIEKQTCDWKDSVKNCDAKTKEKKVKPLLFTDEPLCQEGFLACGDGNCIERVLFCNSEKDCNDGSDENACGKYFYIIGLVVMRTRLYRESSPIKNSFALTRGSIRYPSPKYENGF